MKRTEEYITLKVHKSNNSMKRYLLIIFALMSFIGAQAKTYDLTICRYEPEFYAADNDVYVTLYTEDNVVTIRVDIIVEQGQQFFTNGKTYTWDDMLHPYCNAYVSADFQHYQFADATFTWRLDELGLEHIVGSGTDSLGNTYNFHYDVVPYTPTGDTIDVTFSQTLKMEHSEEWYFSGSEGDYYILLTLINKGNSPVGHYTNENIVMDYSYIDKTLGGGEYEYISFHHAEVDVTAAANDTLKLEALIAGSDTNIYRFHMFYLEPKPTVKKTITATDLYINTDYLYGMVGAFQIEASNETHYVKMAFSPMSDDLSVYDTYTISNRSPNIGYVTDYLSGSDEPSEVYQGAVTISKTETGALLTGTILCYDNTEYTLRLSYDVPEKTRDAEFVMDGMEVTTSQGAWRIQGYSADKTQFISLIFNGFGIEGTYSMVEMSPVYSDIVTDITWAAGEVDTYTYYEMQAANLTATLNPADSIVTVTGAIIAQNSGNKRDVPQFTVRLSSKPASEGIETARPEATVTKRIENGQLLIERDGKTYNAQGAVVR